MKIYAILGDFYHDKQTFKEFLLKVFEKIEVIEIEDLASVLSQKPDLIILAKENRLSKNDNISNETWMHEDLENKIIQYVENGGNWLALHCGMSSFADNLKYTKMLCGMFDFHPEQVLTKYEFTDFPENNFAEVDEHYFVKVNINKTEIVARSFSKFGISFAAWKHNFKLGKVLCYAPSHTTNALNNPNNIEALRKLSAKYLKLKLEDNEINY